MFFQTLFCLIPMVNIHAFSDNLINAGSPKGVSKSFDCKMRQFAYEYGELIQPQHGSFVELFDALQLSACDLTISYQNVSEQAKKLVESKNFSSCNIFVNPQIGNYNFDWLGVNSPFSSIHQAVKYLKTIQKRRRNLCYTFV